MTGPEHYREAERLEQQAARQWGDGQVGDPCPEAMITVQRAQVHATLALAKSVIADAWDEGYAAGQVDDDGDRENPYRSGGAA